MLAVNPDYLELMRSSQVPRASPKPSFNIHNRRHSPTSYSACNKAFSIDVHAFEWYERPDNEMRLCRFSMVTGDL
jgi:hypothetical protein